MRVCKPSSIWWLFPERLICLKKQGLWKKSPGSLPNGFSVTCRKRAGQYLKVMTNVPIGHPFGRLAVQGKLRSPLLLTPIAKGRSYLDRVSYVSLKGLSQDGTLANGVETTLGFTHPTIFEWNLVHCKR